MIKLTSIINEILSDGVRVRGGEVTFDQMNDYASDQLRLFINKKSNRFYSMPTSGLHKIFYAYQFTTYNEYFKWVGERVQMTREEWNESINFVRKELKDYKNPTIVKNVNEMIDRSLLRFDRLEKLSNYDVLVPLKSSSTLNDVIADKIKDRTGAKVLSDTIVKNTIGNVNINLPDTETSDKTRQYLDTIKKKFAGIPDQEFRSKMIKASFRRYVTNFLKYKGDEESIRKNIEGKNVLLIDDTLGEGATLKEMNRLIVKLNPKSVASFIFLKDY